MSPPLRQSKQGLHRTKLLITLQSLIVRFNSLIARFNSLFDRNKFPALSFRELCCIALSFLLDFTSDPASGGCIDENSLLIPC